MHHVMAVSHVHAKLDTYDTYSKIQRTFCGRNISHHDKIMSRIVIVKIMCPTVLTTILPNACMVI